ncbi:hypothetical protein JCM8097_002723 [Rhodosporidiobolus ruineniae]
MPPSASPPSPGPPPPSSSRPRLPRSSKANIGSLAEVSTKDGGIRPITAGGALGGPSPSKKRRKGGKKAEEGVDIEDDESEEGKAGRQEPLMPERDASGRFLSQGGRKRDRKKKEKAEGEEDEALPLDVLQDEERSLLDYKNGQAVEGSLKVIKVGDVVQVIQPGEYAQVEKIRVPRDDLDNPPSWLDDSVAVDDEGTTKRSTRSGCFEVTYFHPLSSFEQQYDPDGAFTEQCKVLGPNELVKTAHRDWKAARALVADASDSRIYCFDDGYPASPPSASKPSTHPLSLYSTATLSVLCPSPYALPALISPTHHPPTALDTYFFGVGSGLDGAEGRSQDAEQLAGGKDGRRGTPWVRTAKRRRKKRKKGKGGYREKREKVQPLTFNLHSTSRRPYDPRKPQVFSPHAKRWYDVEDLLKGGHYTLGGSASAGAAGGDKGKGKAKEQDEVDFFRPSSSGQGRNPSSARQTSPAPSDGSSASDSSSFSLASTFSTAQAAKAGPSRSATANGASTSTDADEVIDQLKALAASTIKRGGAHGLTGNAYLVTRAAELVALLSPPAPALMSSVSKMLAPPLPLNLTPAARFNALTSARAILIDARRWERGVRDRVEGAGEGKGLGKEWRATAEPGRGRRWACPETGRAM